MFRHAGFLHLRASLLYVLGMQVIGLGVGGGAASAGAQSVGPTSTSASSAQVKLPQSGDGSVPTIKAKAQLVIVDVVVTDGKQRPVPGLRASDFTVSEGGVAQAVLHFEEHTALTAVEATKFAAMPKMPPGIFTNYTPAPVNGAVTLLLLDELNTPMRDQAYARQQLLAYLKTAAPGTRIAIFGLTTHLILLQGFTSDPDVLKVALEKTTIKSSPLLEDAVGGSGVKNSQADELDAMGAHAIAANVRQVTADQQSLQLQDRTKYTLDAMKTIAHYLAAIPGRKNLIWFSGSFPINIMADTTGNLKRPFDIMANSEDEFRETTDLLARSQVAVYPVDARGLTNSPVLDATTTRNYTGLMGIARVKEDQDKYFNDTVEEHGTMRTMAAATGGRAFVNTNDLSRAVANAIDDGSNFYTLTYTPTNSARDGKLRKIKVQVARSGVSLAYRQGYYAESPEKASTVAAKTSTAAGSSLSRQTREEQAMMRGAPTPAEIVIKVAVAPVGQNTEDAPAESNTPAEKTHGPYRRYSVDYAIDPDGLTFRRTADSKLHGEFDLVIFVFDRDGALVNSSASRVEMTATLEEVRKMFATGLNRHEEISVPAKGEYFLRIAVHDTLRDHYGAVEVDTAEVPFVAATPTASPIPVAPVTN